MEPVALHQAHDEWLVAMLQAAQKSEDLNRYCETCMTKEAA
jgi:hypothetical protein